jgi:hypothetical protein
MIRGAELYLIWQSRETFSPPRDGRLGVRAGAGLRGAARAFARAVQRLRYGAVKRFGERAGLVQRSLLPCRN